MCGIAGIFDLTKALNTETLERRTGAMADSLRHRGPDDNGVWVDAESGIGLGHRRLAVIAPTPEGRQPTTSQCGRYVLVFNGEVYNFRDMANRLGAAGHSVESASDTVVLLEAIATWGVRKAVEAAIGMFAFAVFDREARNLTLVRDRLGIKPLYWGKQDNRLVFGSEIKALHAAGLIEPTRDPDALATFVRFAYIPAPATIFREIRKLYPGTMMTIGADGKTRSESYWSAKAVARAGQADLLSLEDPVVRDRFEALARQAVTDRMVSDVPLGAWLSGGIDSATVVALMQEASTQKIRTFSMGFPAAGYDESEDAARIAAHLGTDHTTMRVTPEDALAVIESLPDTYDEPFADSSQIPTFILSRLTRDHVTVALSGDGGDEVFGGYNRYVALPSIARRVAAWPPTLRRNAAALLQSLSPQGWDRMARIMPRRMPPQFGDKMWKAAAAIAASDAEQAYLSTVSQWRDPREVVRGTRHTPAPFGLDTNLDDPVAQLQLADTTSYLPDDILTKVDRASMAHSLEVRVPLLDHRLVELAWRLPRSELIGSGITKRPLRHLLAKHVPDSLIDQPKSGFAIPISDWLRGPLRDWAEDLLSETALKNSELLEPAPIRAAWESHLSGRQNLQNPLWAILMYQLWDRASLIRTN
jgi:asparagine synthase (glutamine-hydrolysing)